MDPEDELSIGTAWDKAFTDDANQFRRELRKHRAAMPVASEEAKKAGAKKTWAGKQSQKRVAAQRKTIRNRRLKRCT